MDKQRWGQDIWLDTISSQLLEVHRLNSPPYIFFFFLEFIICVFNLFTYDYQLEHILILASMKHKAN